LAAAKFAWPGAPNSAAVDENMMKKS